MSRSTSSSPTELKGTTGKADKGVDRDGGDDVDRKPKGEEIVGGDELSINDIGFPRIVVICCNNNNNNNNNNEKENERGNEREKEE